MTEHTMLGLEATDRPKALASKWSQLIEQKSPENPCCGRYERADQQAANHQSGEGKRP